MFFELMALIASASATEESVVLDESQVCQAARQIVAGASGRHMGVVFIESADADCEARTLNLVYQIPDTVDKEPFLRAVSEGASAQCANGGADYFRRYRWSIRYLFKFEGSDPVERVINCSVPND